MGKDVVLFDKNTLMAWHGINEIIPVYYDHAVYGGYGYTPAIIHIPEIDLAEAVRTPPASSAEYMSRVKLTCQKAAKIFVNDDASYVCGYADTDLEISVMVVVHKDKAIDGVFKILGVDRSVAFEQSDCEVRGFPSSMSANQFYSKLHPDLATSVEEIRQEIADMLESSVVAICQSVLGKAHDA